MTYRQFSCRFTRLLSKAFNDGLYYRFILHVMINGIERESIQAFYTTIEVFGTDDQCNAYKSLMELMDENPEYVKTMRSKTR